ncbi:hypothetical protein CAPTEDRAFT_209422 [Capitella teleta]|uniref:Uncharacterized protein n=1 Tax=Capitella teleta TaxID=283909 RepID=R7V446_CAPTE|nr:hypothetical protein CAPTEDRAFT_209422 [Capitella teleta]|eukprot:ELU11126.1 hypothetical protein CAPTEDRAFT_209422 [Capitella teleta]
MYQHGYQPSINHVAVECTVFKHFDTYVLPLDFVAYYFNLVILKQLRIPWSEESPSWKLLLVCLANFEKTLGGILVHFIYKNLMSVPEDIAQNVTHLYLIGNDITRIRGIEFNDKYPNLTNLYLRLNDITSIESGCFKGTNLKLFRLSSNELTSIPDVH